MFNIERAPGRDGTRSAGETNVLRARALPARARPCAEGVFANWITYRPEVVAGETSVEIPPKPYCIIPAYMICVHTQTLAHTTPVRV